LRGCGRRRRDDRPGGQRDFRSPADAGGLGMTVAGTSIGRIGFVGGGFMGEGIVQGLLSRGVATANQLRVCDLVATRRDYLNERYAVLASDRVSEVVHGAATVILAVKPQDFEAAAHDLVHELHPDQLVLSIM